MKFLVYSRYGEGAQVAACIQNEGNKVALYIKEKDFKGVFEGLVNKVDNPDSFIDKDTVVIFDMSGMGDVADEYRKRGIKVFGAGTFNDQLEMDREFGYKMMKSCGIKVPDYKEFTDFFEGMKFAEEFQDRLVFKPSGNLPTKLTYVSTGVEELLKYMRYVEKKYGSKIDKFVLQEFIEGSVISSEYFCDGNKFLEPGNHTFEDKKFMNHGLGPSTGCSGNITWTDDSWILKEGIKKFEEICVQNQLVGQIDLNAVVTNKGEVYGLEWTPRFGYDATPTILALIDGEVSEFFYNVVTGKDINMKEGIYAASVRLTIPPYPVDLEKEKSKATGTPIINYEEYEEDCYFYEVQSGEDGLEHSGPTGVILCAVGTGFDVEDSFDYPYEIVNAIIVPDKQYRTDLADVFSEMFEDLYVTDDK